MPIVEWTLEFIGLILQALVLLVFLLMILGFWALLTSPFWIWFLL